MNVKNFIAAGFIGGIVNFLLGWLLYGIIFKDSFPTGENKNMTFIFLACMTFGFLISYIFVRWANIKTALTGLQAGATLSLIITLYTNFVYESMNSAPNYKLIALDIVLMIVIGALVGAVVGIINGKIK